VALQNVPLSVPLRDEAAASVLFLIAAAGKLCGGPAHSRKSLAEFAIAI
jgi:hypothetical protein